MIRSLIILSLLASACRSRTDSHLRVSNPIPAGDFFPEVVKIIGYDWMDLSYICSGVFISSNLLLTAAHCTYSPQGGGLFKMTYTGTDGVVHEGKMFPAPQYQKDGDVVYNARYDLAVISFDAEVAPAVARRTQTTPISGEIITIVGYGETDAILHSGLGSKNLGYNRIQSIESNTSRMTGYVNEQPFSPVGHQSLSGNGDSGGGMFNQRGELSGIVSCGGSNGTKDNLCNLLGESIMVNITHPDSITVLNAINANMCAGKSLQPGEACQGGVCNIH